jgi:hypothetical protein
MEITNIRDDPDCYLNDIREITCLLIYEGNEYRYIHKSVQEYYAASFVENRPDTNAINFYKACLDYNIYRNWEEELLFLSEIDKYRYCKFYLIPLCQKWLGVETDLELAKGKPPLTRERIITLIGAFALTFDTRIVGEMSAISPGCTMQPVPRVFMEEEKLIVILFNIDYRDIWSRLTSGKMVANMDYVKQYHHIIVNKSNYVEITMRQLIEEGFFPDDFKNIAHLIADYLYAKWKGAYSYVEWRDSFDIVSQMNI